MNKMFFYSTLLFLVTMTGCDKKDDNPECPCTDPSNPECPNYDPCYGIEEPTAKIILRETYIGPTGTGPIFTGDDSLFYNTVFFSSPFNGSEYSHKWYLGSEIINAESFNRSHSNVERPAEITVSHVLTYPIDSVCYPFSAGRDSVSRTYSLIKYWNEFAVYSKFRGAFENETDSFDFEFKIVFEDNTPVYFGHPNDLEPVFVAINFDNQGDSTDIAVIGRNLSGYFPGDGNSYPSGTIEIDPETKIAHLEYTYLLESSVVNARILSP